MMINIQNTARNCHIGMQEIDRIVTSYNECDGIRDLLEELNDVFIKYQPLLASYCMDEYFKLASSW